MTRTAILAAALLVSTSAFALPAASDRVYTRRPELEHRLGHRSRREQAAGPDPARQPAPDVLSPLYKARVNVHGLGFSPDHRTLVVVSTVTNSVTFIDTTTNAVKGATYVGRNPHEAFFTPDGKQVWATVRGEDYLSVIDAATLQGDGPHSDDKRPGHDEVLARRQARLRRQLIQPVLEVFDVASHALVKRIPVVSPFVPFVQVSRTAATSG